MLVVLLDRAALCQTANDGKAWATCESSTLLLLSKCLRLKVSEIEIYDHVISCVCCRAWNETSQFSRNHFLSPKKASTESTELLEVIVINLVILTAAKSDGCQLYPSLSRGPSFRDMQEWFLVYLHQVKLLWFSAPTKSWYSPNHSSFLKMAVVIILLYMYWGEAEIFDACQFKLVVWANDPEVEKQSHNKVWMSTKVVSWYVFLLAKTAEGDHLEVIWVLQSLQCLSLLPFLTQGAIASLVAVWHGSMQRSSKATRGLCKLVE